MENYQNLSDIPRNYMSRLGELAVESPGLIVIKPQERVLDINDTENIVRRMISSRKLNIVARKEKVLSSDEVKRMYTEIFDVESDDIEQITYRTNLILYMTGGKSIALYLIGERAMSKACEIKAELREKYGHNFVTKYLKNLIHVPEPEEFERSTSVFWGSKDSE